MQTIFLPQEQWDLVQPVVTGVFNNRMPDSPVADAFLTLLNGSDQPLQKPVFLHVEMLYHFNCVYADPSYGKQRVQMALQLIRDGARCITPGFSGIWLSDRKVHKIAALADARYLGNYHVYRKDG